MSLTYYLNTIGMYRVPDQINIWHVLLKQYLHIICTYCVYYQFNNWHMLLTRYLQTFVSLLVSADVTIKLSKDIYKTRILQKNRKGLLVLNWTISKWVREKAYPEFNKYASLLIDSGRVQKTTTFLVGLLMLIFGISRIFV